MTGEVVEVLEHGVDVLVYQGDLDLACNTVGNLRWAEGMCWRGQAEFMVEGLKAWGQGEGEGEKAGVTKEMRIPMGKGDGERRTRFAFVTVQGSGHMVPQDRPEVALDMLGRWLGGREFD
jgi:cathepsin A (carboxypeptidase C)